MLDEKRYFLSAESAEEVAVVNEMQEASQLAQWQTCRNANKPLSDDWFPEMEPWGISAIQADSQVLQQQRTRNATGTGVMICIIDSGIDTMHPDIRNNSLDGCKFEDLNAPGGCPFPWNEDIFGHGTHVAGVIAGIRNGFGTRGVIPDGAELYMVRVYNDSGDVNQGQGFVYGSSLIQAYTQCEGRLSYLQATVPARKYRMVVNLSLGATGPLTIEQLYFR
jgi:subtilisin family serine protease